MKPMRLAPCVAAGLLCAVLLTACDGDDIAPVRPLENVAASPVVREAWELQRELLAGPAPAAAWEPEVRLYNSLRNEIDDPLTSEAGAEHLIGVWANDPTNPLWVDLALMKWSRIKRRPYALDLLSTAAGPDSSSAEHHFVLARQAWKDPRHRSDPGLFLRAVALAEEGSMPWLVASTKAARTERAAGRVDAAVTRLTGLLPAAWRLGGATLAANVWFDISWVNRESERLNDALLAAHALRVCAEAAHSGWLEARAGLELGRVHLARLEFDEALGVFVDAREVADDSSCYRWSKTASGMAARAANVLGDIEIEKAHLLDLLRTTAAARDSGTLIRTRFALGAVERRLGDLETAAAWYDSAYAADDAWTGRSLRPYIDMSRANLARQLGSYAEAESLRTESARRLPPEAALEAYVNLMRQGLDTGRSDIAYRALDNARRLDTEAIRRTPEYDPVLNFEATAARFHSALGEHALAYAAQERARQRNVETAPRKSWFVKQAEGLVALGAGDVESARAAFERCVELAAELGNPGLERRSRIHLGGILIDSGETEQAAALFAEDLEVPRFWPRLNAQLLTGLCHSRAGDPRAALDMFARIDADLGERSSGRFEARLRLEQARAEAALGDAAAAYLHLQEARDARTRLAKEAETDLGRTFDTRIEREIAAEILDLLRDHPELIDGDPVPVTRDVASWGAGRDEPVRRTADPRIEFFVGDRRAHAWILPGAGGAGRWVSLGDVAPLVELLESLQVDMTYPGRAVDRSAVAAAGELLLEPARDVWTRGATLEILPDDALAGVPWAALGFGPGGDVATIDHGPLVIVTGGSGTAAPRTDAKALLVLGANGSSDPAGAGRLVHAETEAAAVASLWPAGVDLRLGADARWPDLRRGGAAGYRAIHIATHTRVYEGLEGRSTIHVAGFEDAVPLTIPEIPSLGADAELVYLSSCEGARRHRSTGHGVTSFAEAFVEGGAGAVVASSVLVDDEASSAAAAAFYRHWLGGKSRAAALRAALLEVRDADPRWGHPFYWAFTNLYRPAG